MKQVFVSVQATCNVYQQLVVEQVYAALHKLALTPVRVNKSQEGYDPLPEIRQLMLRCNGALIIALERFRWSAGVEYPDSPYATSYTDYRSSTIWNHIEAAMAYQAGLPILILHERGLHQAGMLAKELGSSLFAEFSIHECINSLPGTIHQSLEEWSRVVMS